MPIVIVDKLDWVDASSLDATRKQINQALAQWLKTDKSNVLGTVSVTNLAVIEYPGEAGMVLSRFDVLDAKQRVIKKELYWKKESGQWKIALDNTL